MVRNIIKKLKDKALFENPKKIYYKEKNLLNKPFFFKGSNKEAVLLIHGWTSVPYELRRLGKYLHENGYTVSGPVLRGHGTVPKNLEKVFWQDWLKDVTEAYEELTKKYVKVHVIGTSVGANLSVVLAKNKPTVSSLVIMAMPYKVRLERSIFIVGKILLFFGKKYSRKFYPPTFGSPRMITRIISYQTYPIVSVFEILKLVKISRGILGKVKQPCYVLQSVNDYIVEKNSLEKIFKNIGSKNKKKTYVKKSFHTFISDTRKENIFEDILKFIKEN